jgi:VRR-NUC domain.
MQKIKKYNNEADLKDHVRDAIKKKYGRRCFFFKTHDICRVGIPDIFMVFCGRAVVVELKMPGNDLKPLQKYNLKMVRSAGGCAFGAYDVETILRRLAFIEQEVMS